MQRDEVVFDVYGDWLGASFWGFLPEFCGASQTRNARALRRENLLRCMKRITIGYLAKDNSSAS